MGAKGQHDQTLVVLPLECEGCGPHRVDTIPRVDSKMYNYVCFRYLELEDLEEVYGLNR